MTYKPTKIHRPKVLHIIPQLELLGGAERQLVYLVQALSGQYAFHVVLYHEDAHSHIETLRELEVPVDLIVRAPGVQGKWQFMMDLTRMVRDIAPDILQLWLISAHAWGSLAYGLSGWRGPLIAAVRNAVPDHWLMSWVYRVLMMYTDVITCDTHRTRKDLLAHGICAQKVVYIPNGIDAGAYDCPAGAERMKREWGIPPDKTVIGTIGRIAAQKNPMIFVDMARSLTRSHADVHFVMVGDGELRQRVEEAIAREGLREVFTLVGTQRDIAAWLDVLDIFVLTSGHEGLPNAVMEAMCARVPVVATAVGGVPELLAHGESGCLVDAGDVTGLVRQVSALLGDRPGREALGQRGRQVIEMHYALDRMAETAAKVYQKLLSA